MKGRKKIKIYIFILIFASISFISAASNNPYSYNLIDDESFLGLDDTPSSYSGQGTNCLRVNSAATGLIFGDCNATGGSGGNGNTTDEIQAAVGTGAGGGSGGFGEGLTYEAPFFNHSDTSNQSDSDNSGTIGIQSLFLDKFGHLLSIVTFDINISGFLQNWEQSLAGIYRREDNNTFNGDINITGNLTAPNITVRGNINLPSFSNGSILFTTNGDVSSDSSNLFWSSEDIGLGIGSSETSETVGGVTKNHVISTHSQGGQNSYDLGFHRHSATSGTFLMGLRSRGSESSPSIVEDGDNLLDIFGIGYDGVDYEFSSAIKFEVDGIPIENNMPGRITFGTTPNGSTTDVERMRIDSAGNIGIGTTIPKFLLHVAGNLFVKDILQFSTDFNASYGIPNKIDLFNSTINKYGFGVSAGALDLISDGAFQFWNSNGTHGANLVNISGDGQLYANSDVCDGDLNCLANITALRLENNASFPENVTSLTDFYTQGKSLLGSRAENNNTFPGNLTVTENVSIQGDLHIDNDLNVSGALGTFNFFTRGRKWLLGGQAIFDIWYYDGTNYDNLAFGLQDTQLTACPDSTTPQIVWIDRAGGGTCPF